MDFVNTFHAFSEFFRSNEAMLTIVGAVAGGGLALKRYYADQSWKKKQFAYDYVQTVSSDRKAMTALRMLDWGRGDIPEDIAQEFQLPDEDRRWDAVQVGRALRVHDLSTSDPMQGSFTLKETVIREVFDACLAHFERLGHFLKSGVISRGDFPTTLAYYIDIMREDRMAPIREPLRHYMKRYGFDCACYVFDTLSPGLAQRSEEQRLAVPEPSGKRLLSKQERLTAAQKSMPANPVRT